MKIIIISDIHDNIPNLEKCLDWCRREGIGQMISCGDTSDIDTVEYLAKNFSGEIYLVRGNVDNFNDRDIVKFKNIHYFGKIGHVVLDNIQIGLCHEPFLISKVMEKPCQIIFYGHTHKPWMGDRDGVKMINPGALSGLYYDVATIALWETESGKLELKRIEDL